MNFGKSIDNRLKLEIFIEKGQVVSTFTIVPKILFDCTDIFDYSMDKLPFLTEVLINDINEVPYKPIILEDALIGLKLYDSRNFSTS